jgi:hypothetical protein
MNEFFTSGNAVNLVLFVVACELLILALVRWKTGRGIPGIDLVANAASGVCLLLALRAALTQQPWIWIALALAGSFVAHVVDLSRRWSAQNRADVSSTENHRIHDANFHGTIKKNLY